MDIASEKAKFNNVKNIYAQQVEDKIMETLSILDVLSNIYTNIKYNFLSFWRIVKHICPHIFCENCIACVFRERIIK